MNRRRALCLVLAALFALQPVAPALADGAAPSLAPAQLDQLMSDRYGPLSYRPQADADQPDAALAGAAVPAMAAASGGGDGASSSASIWVIVAVVVVVALVAGGGGGGGGY